MSMLKKILLASLALLTVPAFAQEQIEVNYSYDGNANLSSIRAAVKLGEFSDSRSVDNPNLIIAQGLGSDTGYSAEAPLAEIVRDAFVQALTKGEANIVEADEEMQVVGEILDASAELVDQDGVESIQITIRTSIELQRGGRSLFDTTLFGRGVAPADEGLAAAVHAALNRMVRELTGDDYFLMRLN
jgi:hypothetical protein